ncbi:homoserine dehydrogenase [Bacillus badius]|uniref:Homoserine dehydrogenase n=1 Tax=Bacillus badius TaxID=1455 RepID=A0ABR5AWN8_BACBA|nr:homoserine dehydrogenase [Bacillus badius]KIL79139.1 Homoserine dehydrogenase [Bacillus badius]KZN99569.1 homoserine dehydrogenase [Bacillus badius]KZR57957.1 homoserine dehydrogenase [Bacillus badius]MED0665911.1 homoserine dehydrogenase [Bacillus badius]MED4718768.1 homoserine dehydrogenase [Bacillus badius]
MKDNVKVGLLGLGTVGTGVVKMIQNHQEQLVHQVGCPVSIKKVLVKNPDKVRDVELDSSLLTTDPYDVINDPEIDVIVEVIGGIEETRKYIIDALNSKKQVVTANKDLIALHGSELQKIAAENGCDLFYEASVAGGIPIIKGLADGLASDKIQKMMGIVNGTTNYILTKMTKDGLSYETALKDAQDLGFAEADPTSDVEGLDAARKMAILARLAFSMDIELDDVSVSGISSVTKDDLKYGSMLGYTMKLIGYADQENDRAEVSVQPTFLENDHPLASVHDEYNAVYVYGEAVGETMFYGPGAGSLPTATSIVSDVLAVVKNMRLGVNGRSALAPQFDRQLKAANERFAKYFIRLHVRDEVGAFSELTKLFSSHSISFEKILQLPLEEEGVAEIVIVTHNASMENYQNVLSQVKDLDVVKGVESFYRVEGEGTAK